MSSKASTVVIRTIFTVMLTAMFAGCGGGSTGNSALIGSGSTAENSRGSPSLPSTISPATEMPEDIITANGTAKLVLREDFQANSPSSPNILSLQGATLISSAGVAAMHTDQNGWAKINTGTHLSPRAGTLVMWVKPAWTTGDGSHPLATLRWQDGREGYLALTQGWWEPLGAKRLFFIVNNQDGMHCSAPYQLTPNVWNMVTAVRQSGQNGYCKLFVNGEKIAEYQGPFQGDYVPVGPLYLGSERGATDQRGRTTKADFAALRLFDGPLLDTEIHDLFLQRVKAAGFNV